MSETLKIIEPQPSQTELLVSQHLEQLNADSSQKFVSEIVGSDVNNSVRIAEATEYINALEKNNGRESTTLPMNENVEIDHSVKYDYAPVQKIDELINQIDKCRSQKDSLSNRHELLSLETEFQNAFDKCEAQGFDHDFLEAMLNRVYPPKNIEKNEPAFQDSEAAVIDFKNPETTSKDIEAGLTAETKEIVNTEIPSIIEPDNVASVGNNYKPTDAQKEKFYEMFNQPQAEVEPDQENLSEKSIIERAKDLWLKAGMLFGAAKSKVVEFGVPKRLESEAQEDYEKRLRRFGTARALGVTAIALIGGYELVQIIGGGHEAAVSAAQNIDPSMASVATSPELANLHVIVSPGDGWFEAFKQIGVPKTEWHDVLSKIGDQLVSRGVAYPNGDSFGIISTGQLPDDVIKLIQSSIN